MYGLFSAHNALYNIDNPKQEVIMCNTTKETKEFFMFSYFGILPEEIFKEKKNDGEFSEFQKYEDYVAYKCSYRAYLDVCRTIKYSVTTTQIDKNKTKYAKYKELKKAFIEYEIKLIFDGLDDLLKYHDDFDVWHKKTCGDMTLKNTDDERISKLLDNNEQIIDAFNRYKLFNKKNSEFTYGMAQKWLNMTIKNLLLAEDMFNGCTGYESLCHKRELFHVPVDKNILKAAKSDFNITGYSESWSSWGDTTYAEFIKPLGTQLTELNPKKSMLDWEHYAWMKYAE